MSFGDRDHGDLGERWVREWLGPRCRGAETGVSGQ